MTGSRVLIAGVGNVFLGDDGFGVQVVRRMEPAELPADVDVADYGIRGVHLAYDLLDDRYGTLILVDAVPLGERPGTLAVVEVPVEAPDGEQDVVDAHSLTPQAVLAALRRLGGRPPRVLVVGCEPAAFDHGMELSPAVAAAVDEAARIAGELAVSELAGTTRTEVTGARAGAV